MKKVTLALVAVLALGAFAAACDDDGGDVRTTGEGSESGSGSGSASGSKSGSASGSEAHGGSGSASGMDHGGEAACEKVGTDLEATQEIRVSLGEFTITPEVDTVDAGTVKFVVENEGGLAHELAIAKGKPADQPKDEHGAVDVAAIPAGGFVGEIKPFPAQSECEGTFELAAGDYTLFCNIVEEVGGEDTSHVAEGMAVPLTVQ